MNKFKAYIYKLECPITGEFYIGSRKYDKDPKTDSYMGSYSRWNPIDKKSLIKTIVFSGEFDKNELLNLEGNIIKEYISDPLNRNYHIPSELVFSMHGTKHNESTISKMKESRSLLPVEIIKCRIGKKHSDQSKKKMSNSQKGRIITEEHKVKISNTLKGRTLSEETKQKMRDSGGKRNEDKFKQTIKNKQMALIEKIKELEGNGMTGKEKSSLLNISYPTYIKLKKIINLEN